MKILLWTDAFWPDIGGLENFCVNLVRGLQARGHTCAVISNRPGRDLPPTVDFEGSPVHGFPFREALRYMNVRLLAEMDRACARVMDDFAPDVIHLHGIARSAFPLVKLQKHRRRPAIVTLHDSPPAALPPHTAGALVLQNVDRIVAVSEFIRRAAEACDASLAPRLRTILNAVPAPALAPAPLPPTGRVLAFGHLAQHKGFDLAIRAFAQIAAEFPDSTLTLAGEGPERAQLTQLALATAAGRVHFTGLVPREKIAELINAHAIVVVPSRWEEPFGLVALEASQLARPVIATRRGGLPEIIIDRATGLLVESDDLPAMTQALRTLLADPPLAVRLGEAGRQRAARHFSFDAMLRHYEETCQEAIALQRDARPPLRVV